jgi:hypothetical protein
MHGADHSSLLSISETLEIFDMARKIDAASTTLPSKVTTPVALAAPNFGENASEVQKNEWRKSASIDTAALLLDGDLALMRLIAMALIDYQRSGGEASAPYFDDRLKELGLESAGDKVMMRAATVASGLDRRDRKTGEKAGKLLDSIATSMEGLAIVVGRATDFSYSYTQDCVGRLISIILETKGGIRALANIARNEVIAVKESGVVALDRALVADIVKAKVQERFRAAGANTFSLARTDSDGKLIPVPGVLLDLDAVTRAMTGTDVLEGRAQALYELQFATKAIAREPTDKVKVIGSDLRDKRTEKRHTEPHIVACPGGEIIVSAHFAEASNVIRISGLSGVFDEQPKVHVMLPPEVHNKLGRNLAKADQRNAVTITEEPPAAGTSLAYRTLKMRSGAALNPRYGPDGEGLSFSWRFPTYGRNGPEDAVPTMRPDRQWSPERTIILSDEDGLMNRIVASRSRLDRSASQRKPVELSLGAGKLMVRISKDSSLSCRADGAELQVRVSAADLRGLLVLLEELRPTDLALAIDSGRAALRWTFRSSRAAYELFMPCTGESGTRLKAAFAPLELVTPETEPRAGA